MIHETCGCNLCQPKCHCTDIKHEPDKNISIDFELYQAKSGRYFIGQTPLLNQSSDNAMIALINPTTSTSIVYVNIQTISSLSSSVGTAYFYIGGFLPSVGTNSIFISNTNTNINPQPRANAQIQYLTNSPSTPIGISQFMRIIPITQTVVDEIGGRIILSPGQSLVILLQGLVGNIAMAFGWWEKSINNKC